MKIFGLEKLSLVDYGSNACAVVFTGACNFKCPFCHNGGLVNINVPQIPTEEVLRYLKKRYGLIDAVCVSGGEPTLQEDLLDFLKELKQIGYKVKLDTNGTNPQVLMQAIQENLVDYVAMDVKNCFKKYAETSGVSDVFLENIKQSLQILKQSGIDYELRTTLVKEFHLEDDIKQMATELAGHKKMFLQNFIDSPNCIKKGLNSVDISFAKNYVEILKEQIESVSLRGYVW